MFIIEKYFQGHRAILLNDPFFGKLIINNEVICEIKWKRDVCNAFLDLNWKRVKTLPKFIEKPRGKYKFISNPLFDFYMVDTTMKGKLEIYAPVIWFEEIIELLIKGDFDTVSRKKIVKLF